MAHQHAAVAKVGGIRVAGLFMDMGTGKSLTAIMLAEMRQAKIDKVFWGCPHSLRQTIVGQILEHTDATLADIHILTGNSKEADILAASWIVFGIESVGQSDDPATLACISMAILKNNALRKLTVDQTRQLLLAACARKKRTLR
jgi:hypothetical protein